LADATATAALERRREAALARLVELEVPTFRGTAGWEFTPIDKLDLDAHPVASGGQAPSSFGLDEASPEGAIVLPLAQAAEEHPELVDRHLGSVVRSESPFVARNDAHWTDGTFVYVPRNTIVEAPIVISTAHEQAGTALHWRLLVVLEEGAQASVWHESTSAEDGLVNGVVEIVVGQNAQLRFVDLQDLEESTWVFGTQRATVGRDGSLDWITLGFGSANGKVFQETQLAGPGAHGSVTGAYATRGRQHVDFDTLQEHAAPDTTSDLAFRGILAGRSSAVWRGMIKVDPGAQRTDAFQESRNLLLSKRAHADAIPGLEILANDVRCTHAAAIAQIDRDQLFYLRSHGLPEAAAQRLVIEGFLQALVERLVVGPVREAVGAALERRLATVLDTPSR
jgi:Fe-S cluster assembly protein SufD